MKSHPLSQYYYEISDNNIRSIPIEPRDHARLFVYNTTTDTIHFDYFYNIARYLPEQSLMIMNNTGVIPARVTFTKDTGGSVQGMVLYNEGFRDDGSIAIIVNKQIFPGRRLAIGDYWFTIVEQIDQKFYVQPDHSPELLSEILMKHGTTPTPYYLGNIAMTEDGLRKRYQTIFSENNKSVAAPTASLHITDTVLHTLTDKDISTAYVTLDVGLGTFAEIEDKNISDKYLHTEPVYIPAEAVLSIQKAQKNHQKIIAVGTTSVRTLESYASEILINQGTDIAGTTNIFIMPPYDFKIIDHLITNFHVPQSSLMALVDAFLQYKKVPRTIMELYDIALKNDFQFYSFGDSMLIL